MNQTKQEILKQISKSIKTVRKSQWRPEIDYWLFEDEKLFWNHSYNYIKGYKGYLRRAITKRQLVNAIYEIKYS